MLDVEEIHTYYGDSYVLQGISLRIEPGQVVGIVGRNGMGKTTLIRSIIGFTPPRRGRVRFKSRDITGWASNHVVGLGLGLVPQGRRIFPSLTTDEHLRMLSRSLVGRGQWDVDAVYDLYPRLAERRKVSAAMLSGGEQQMLAIGRALLTNPKLLLMDEPSEGLAPTIVEQLTETCRTLVAEGLTLLLVEQNLGMATAVADRLLVMVHGEVALETTSAELLADPDAQRRYLGVEPSVV